MPRIVCAFGTRPERLKMAPVVAALRAQGAEVVGWCSGQSKDLVGDRSAPIDWPQRLVQGIANCSDWFGEFLDREKPDAVLVQGDTATAFACALAAWLAGVPVGHVEAGLRTYASEPYPEEGFRRMIADISTWHFAPDDDAACNVHRELGGYNRSQRKARGVYVTGNPIIDTLPREPFRVLVTLHRRENWGERIQNALYTLRHMCNVVDHDGTYMNPDLHVTVIRHPNWAQFDYAGSRTSGRYQVVEPMPHADLIARIREADVVVTDSGGLQEEAAHFGKPCIVVRSSTERVGLVRAGAVTVVSPDDPAALRDELARRLAMRRVYGDGDSGQKIARILIDQLEQEKVA